MKATKFANLKHPGGAIAPAMETNAKARLELNRQRELGQYFTPSSVADFMASLFELRWRDVRLLDAGAGDGALTAAVVRRLCRANPKPKSIEVTAYEVDAAVISNLRETLVACRESCAEAGIPFNAKLYNDDFIASVLLVARNDLFAAASPDFNLAIANPPYRKIRSDSPQRRMLSRAGIETSNLYTGFLALITRLLAPGGELVAITPRSFCNGPYFRPFRQELLETMALRRLHLFESRSSAFSADDVLQENIILHAVKSAAQDEQIVISSSSGEPATPTRERIVAFREVVAPDDPQRFIHLTLDETQAEARAAMTRFTTTLPELGLSVSTGRVVDFRAKEFLRPQPEAGTVPLIYPCHFNGTFVSWPRGESRKPNAIVNNERTQELLAPAGVYVLTKRFTSKEERRRIVACIYDADRVSASSVGFENHLNYFHCNGSGLPMNLAKGLAAFLNATMVDVYFRQFNGHTQVNATDLRSLRYPSRSVLGAIGRQITSFDLTQSELDALIAKELDGEHREARQAKCQAP